MHDKRDFAGVINLRILRREFLLGNVITKVLIRERRKQKCQRQRRSCDGEAEDQVMEGGMSQGMWMPLEAGKAKKQISPRASRRNGALLTP